MTMVQAPPRARGSATIRGAAKRENRIAFTASVRNRLGPFTITQLVAIELAAVAVGATLGRPLPFLIGGGVVAFVLLIAVFIPSGGRWLYQSVPMRRRLKARRKAAMQVRDDDLLEQLSPDISVSRVEDRDAVIGVARDGAGWFAALAMGGPDGIGAPVPFERLTRLFTEAGAPVSAIQVIAHTVPVGVAIQGSPAAQSYQELLGGTAAVVHQTSWLAVRLDLGDAADAAVNRGGGVEGVHKSLAVTVSRIGKALRNAGVTHRVLDDDGLRAALKQSLALTTISPTANPRTNETWKSWQAGGLEHITHRIRSWPSDMATLPRVLDEVAAVPAAFTTVSVTISPGPVSRRAPDGAALERRIEVRGLVRLSCDPASSSMVCGRLREAAAQVGARLARLDGEHGPAAYASAPTGGGPR
ncbi:type VII secretion protein EccE [Phytomonospora sp. NPDC050363]|uniref:type VII secretion protein EccE n=1 Tax=Phytomonospora sp. NPDC050363 TaxID=3155642 RepID=UPI0033EE79E9